MHQKDIQEKDPFGQNNNNNNDEAEKSFLKALLAERALKNNEKYFQDKTELAEPNEATNSQTTFVTEPPLIGHQPPEGYRSSFSWPFNNGLNVRKYARKFIWKLVFENFSFFDYRVWNIMK